MLPSTNFNYLDSTSNKLNLHNRRKHKQSRLKFKLILIIIQIQFLSSTIIIDYTLLVGLLFLLSLFLLSPQNGGYAGARQASQAWNGIGTGFGRVETVTAYF